MREHKVLYFSADPRHIIEFYDWAEGKLNLVKWYDGELDEDEKLPEISIKKLPIIIGQQEDLDNLYVIIDYLTFNNDDGVYDANDIVRRTILHYPEVDFLFDQSKKDGELRSGIDFLFHDQRMKTYTKKIVKEIIQPFHIFSKGDGLAFTKIDYDNLFDGSNLRWAIKKFYYKELEAHANFGKLQDKRKDSLAIVIDDEPRQSRFNGFALFASGYRVIPVNTARMLAALNKCIQSKIIKLPQIIVRDFDLQFPDVREGTDYKGLKFLSVPQVSSVVPGFIIDDECEEKGIEGFREMIDYIRDYRYKSEDSEDKGVESKESKNNKWFLSGDTYTLFWGELRGIDTYIVTNGHDNLDVNPTRSGLNEKTGWYSVRGILKPISGLYHPFFSYFKDKNKLHIVKRQFHSTRYNRYEKNKEQHENKEQDYKYEIIKKRTGGNHGVPIDIYDTISEMLRRAEMYYEEGRYVKSAVVAQEVIEFLNGFHYQIMIKAYQLKTKAENAIAMDVVGADEKQLVLDALDRIKIIKEDVSRMVYPLYKGEVNPFKDIETQYERRRKEHQILGHIFSDCRATCRDNEYYEVEAVFIREMAHLDESAMGLMDLLSYFRHYWSIFFPYVKGCVKRFWSKIIK